SSLGVVLMRLWISEVDQNPIAHVFRYEAVETLHSVGDALLIRRNDLASILRVHTRRHYRRAHQVGEHDRDLTAFGSVLELRFGHGLDLRCGRGSASKLTDCTQNLAAITKDNAEVFQVLICQVAQNRKINAVFSKASRVLGHAELFEPIGNLLHGRKPPRDRAYGALDEDTRPNLWRELTGEPHT